MISADSSSLILLAKSSVLETVASVDELVISECVYKESVTRGKEKGRDDSLLIEKLVIEGKISIKKALPKDVARLMKAFGIKCGENETVAIAEKEGCRLVLTDDRKNMTVCKMMGIPYMVALDAIIDLRANGKITPDKAEKAFMIVADSGWIGDDILRDRREKLKKGR